MERGSYKRFKSGSSSWRRNPYTEKQKENIDDGNSAQYQLALQQEGRKLNDSEDDADDGKWWLKLDKEVPPPPLKGAADSTDEKMEE